MIKVVRSLVKASQLFQEKDQLENESLCIKAAQMTIDVACALGDKFEWDFQGLGYDETWEEKPAQST